MIHRLTIATFVILWFGCRPADPYQDVEYQNFDLKALVQQLIENQASVKNYTVHKISTANGIEEQSEIGTPDSLFWEKELTPLLKADINKPSLKGVYKISDGVADQKSNLQRLVYAALPSANADVMRLEIKYLDNASEVRQVIAWISTKNPVYDSKQKISLWVNKYNNRLMIDSLSIKGFNKTIMQDSLIYQTRLIVNH